MITQSMEHPNFPVISTPSSYLNNEVSGKRKKEALFKYVFFLCVYGWLIKV